MFARAHGVKNNLVVHPVAIMRQYGVQKGPDILGTVYVQLRGTSQKPHRAYQSWKAKDMVTMIMTDKYMPDFVHRQSQTLHCNLYPLATVNHVVFAV